MFNKRFSNKWQFLASYVYGKATGTIDNGQSDSTGRHGGQTTTVATRTSGSTARATRSSDPTHMIKVQATYVLPFDINFNAYFHSITGRAWARAIGPPLRSSTRAARPSSSSPAAPNTTRWPRSSTCALEKTFLLSRKYRLGIILDVFNVLNDNTIMNWGTRIDYDWIPGDTPSTDGHELLSFVDPRAARVGIRLMF